VTLAIHAVGAYLPRRRFVRQAATEALAWRLQPGRAPRGTRAVANWDEDALTMAVEAGRAAMNSSPVVEAVVFASTTHPFADRSNAGLLAEALGLGSRLRTQDAGGSQRAATSALAALVASPPSKPVLLVAAERRRTRAGSPQELSYGDGAAALVVGAGAGGAECLGAVSHAIDFVDHYREAGQANDYSLEERWVRSEAMGPMIDAAVRELLETTGTTAAALAHVAVAAPAVVGSRLVRTLERPADVLVDPLHDAIGDLGAAHPLFLLAHALGRAKPGELILLVGFGQGVDAVLVRVGEGVANASTVAAQLGRGVEDRHYTRLLAHGGALELDAGMRAERDARTSHSVHYRHHQALNGFHGGRCRSCGTVQVPPAPACVNPDCRTIGEQDLVRLADTPGRVKTYTEDWLAYTPAPPYAYGNVALEGGGNVFIEYADVEAGDLAVGLAVTFVFRIKDVDRVRGFHRYFWKATPERSL
jgi:3-hydroxy-3-methylglutaryl CoA synthase